MQKSIIGKKLGMTQIFDENGKFIPVTVIEAGPCVVVQKKTMEKDGYESVQIGYDLIKADIFAEGERVDVVGRSKGKGYAGVIKRWNFARLKESHGTGPVARKGGSIGMNSTPSRVFKGKKMSGHLGNERVTVQNLDVVKVDAENNIIAVKGAVPGPKGGIVVISDSVKRA